jgi:hypothetical protein
MSSPVVAPTSSKKKPKRITMSLAAFNAPKEGEAEAYFNSLPASGLVDSSKVCFSQSSAGNSYSSPFQFNLKEITTLQAHFDVLSIDKTDLYKLTPRIQIVLYKAQVMCVTGNRRLWVHKKAGLPIPYEKYVRDEDEKGISALQTVDPEAPRMNLTIR